MQFRTDLAIEAREIAGENTGGIEFKNTVKTVLKFHG